MRNIIEVLEEFEGLLIWTEQIGDRLYFLYWIDIQTSANGNVNYYARVLTTPNEISLLKRGVVDIRDIFRGKQITVENENGENVNWKIDRIFWRNYIPLPDIYLAGIVDPLNTSCLTPTVIKKKDWIKEGF